MKKANLNGVRPAIRKRPVVGRLIILAWLVALPFMAVFYIIYEGCKEALPEILDTAVKMFGVIFLPWEDRP